MTGLPRARRGEGGEETPTGEAVARFLRANPGWLAENPGLYAALAPPVRVHGEIFADHMAAMIQAARTQAASLAGAARAASGLAELVQAAVLALLRTVAEGGDVENCLSLEVPGLLGLDAVTLCVEGANPPSGARALPAGTVTRLLGARDVVFRAAPVEEILLLHGEAARLARQDALVRVPHGQALLALAARDATALHAGQGAGALAFLGRAVASVLRG